MEKWERYPHIWKTKAHYYAWLRGQFRRIWARYPVKIEFKKNNQYPPPPGYTGRGKNLGTCALCGEKDIPISKLEVDHIDTTGGFDDEKSAFEWFSRLLCEEENMQLVHKECHKIKSYADRQGIDFAEAMKEKKVIQLMKSKQDKGWLELRGVKPESNAKKRREQIKALMD